MRLMALFFLLLVLSRTSYAAAPADDEAAIRSVIEQFRSSIIEKDKDRFLATFLHNQVTWQPATSDERLALEAQAAPDAQKVPYDPDSTPEKFIEGISNNQRSIEETFSDVEIDTDGTVASVAFDFEFLVNGKATNAGREYWLLVKTPAGWKISAVVWSRNTPQRASSMAPGSPSGSRPPRGRTWS